ncbi:hypothetical protein OBBRIDRAFT_807876 [Obba rivulosa]|uniref:Uncharacterized protein n=1 Tax=Obba rivulosa TaxID=1052685 RepID=A0A8E2DJP5_9APHY|nr:hypothetical protein OBBRIDRAFT_807876 [Obba rivulosa]
MPSLAAVVSAIVGGCVLLTLILSYAIWSIRRDQAQIQRQRRSQQRTDCYALQLFERNQRARRVNPIFTSPTQDRVESPECIPYSYPPVPSTSSLPRPKPTRPRTPPSLYETHPFSEEVCIAFPPGLNEDVASSVSQDLTEVRISEELEIAEIAEEIAGISGARRIEAHASGLRTQAEASSQTSRQATYVRYPFTSSLIDSLAFFHFPYPIGIFPYPFQHWFVAIRKSPSPQGRVVRPNPKQYGLWGSVVFRSRVVAGYGLSFDEGRG